MASPPQQDVDKNQRISVLPDNPAPSSASAKNEDENQQVEKGRSGLAESMSMSEAPRDPAIVTWEEYDMHKNPRKWATSHRYVMVIIVSLYSVQSHITSSMTASALDVLMDQFHVSSRTLGNMMMSIQVLALAVGPIVFAPMSEKFGRKNVIQLMNLMYVLLTDTAS